MKNGYQDVEFGGTGRCSDRRTEAIVTALRTACDIGRPERTLVVGCGSGVEAAVLGDVLSSRVIGIDIRTEFDARARACIDLRYGDARCLEFPDRSFDVVYSYHALEHIPEYRQALKEMSRVLKPHGIYCIGTPNRSRVIGYLGSKDASLRTKLRWNLDDWSARLRGRFRNQYGAHAGFTGSELGRELKWVFGESRDITADYYRALYPAHRRTVDWLEASRLSGLLFPSVYFSGRRAG